MELSSGLSGSPEKLPKIPRNAQHRWNEVTSNFESEKNTVEYALYFQFHWSCTDSTSTRHFGESYTRFDSVAGTLTNVTTTDSTYSNWIKETSQTMNFAFPVGVEFKITDPLSFRFGANYFHSITNLTIGNGRGKIYPHPNRTGGSDRYRYDNLSGLQLT